MNNTVDDARLPDAVEILATLRPKWAAYGLTEDEMKARAFDTRMDLILMREAGVSALTAAGAGGEADDRPGGFVLMPVMLDSRIEDAYDDYAERHGYDLLLAGAYDAMIDEARRLYGAAPDMAALVEKWRVEEIHLDCLSLVEQPHGTIIANAYKGDALWPFFAALTAALQAPRSEGVHWGDLPADFDAKPEPAGGKGGEEVSQSVQRAWDSLNALILTATPDQFDLCIQAKTDIAAALTAKFSEALTPTERTPQWGGEVAAYRCALHHADSWIASAPHGDNCFVSDNYEGDPGNRCNCGRESALDAIMHALNRDPDYIEACEPYAALASPGAAA